MLATGALAAVAFAWLLLLLLVAVLEFAALLLLLLVAATAATLDSVVTSLEVTPAADAALAGWCFFVGLRLGSLLVALPLPEIPPTSVGQSPTLLKSLAYNQIN